MTMVKFPCDMFKLTAAGAVYSAMPVAEAVLPPLAKNGQWLRFSNGRWLRIVIVDEDKPLFTSVHQLEEVRIPREWSWENLANLHDGGWVLLVKRPDPRYFTGRPTCLTPGWRTSGW